MLIQRWRRWFSSRAPAQRWTLIILAGVLLWVGLGSVAHRLFGSNTTDEASTKNAPREISAISVRDSAARPYRRIAELYGETAPSRDVSISAQTQGEVVAIVGTEGGAVRKGDTIVRIAMQDRRERLRALTSAVAQREKEYEAASKLASRGFDSVISQRRARAALDAARADLARMELDISYTDVTAPFDGIIERIQVDPGDFAGVGVFGVESAIARVIALDPLLVRGNLSQADRPYADMGQPVRVQIGSGAELEGRITYLAQAADEASRSFPLEVTLENPEHTLKAGLSARLFVPLEEHPAHHVPASALSLDDAGGLRIKAVGVGNVIASYRVQVLGQDADGLWVDGLPEKLRLITAGHHYVSAGDVISDEYIQGE